MSPWGGQSLSIYGYVLSTGSVDEAANTWIITIDERRHLRRRTTLHRQNDYQMGNFKPMASRELASLSEWKSWNASKRRSRSDLQTLFEFARFVGAYRPINYVVVKPERGTISGLLAAYEIGRLVNCSIEPKLLEDTPSTRMSAFCVEGFSYEDPAEAI
ncbi:hypothetical protein D6C80_08955 [Aureobasidium pullulans]|nr:hypothetical protein D6C80_08955 [Aureobasidium pullulans]